MTLSIESIKKIYINSNLKAISNSYIGIHQDYLFHHVAKFLNLNINYELLRQEFENFFQKFKDNNIQPLVVLGQFTNHNLNPQLLIQTCIKKNQYLYPLYKEHNLENYFTTIS
ncbi:hypothetical protein FGO68_gene7572 [Halteria grandinella]|uniref:Uncharacterized protein n=1 Tax=Halteria grandinella TaxID=5974 RepID=A0A8J8SY08_HALGN|nr:hypothetical protein FGO68_gene7572 [Halteria grandinella]